MTSKPTITAFEWVPFFAQGQVRDLRVRWAFEEVGQDYDVRYLGQGEHKQAAHRMIQPYGQVPTLEDGDLTLFESGAIVHHIATTRPGLMPDAPDARARAVEWMFAALNTVEPPIMDQAIATIFEADQPWSAPRLPAIQARIRERLAETAARLGDAEWFDGAFSAGDLMMVAVLRILREDPLLEERPTLAAYVARGEARAAFQRAVAAQMAGFTASAPPQFVEWERQLKAKMGETA